MKRVLTMFTVVMIITAMFLGVDSVYAANAEEVIDTNTESKLISIKNDAENSLDDYKVKYGSDAYGLTAYVLNIVRIYSIPFCFLGIAVSAIYQYVLGIRKLDIQEKGLVLMVTFVTLLIICQILPLAFAIVVKFGRG